MWTYPEYREKPWSQYSDEKGTKKVAKRKVHKVKVMKVVQYTY